MLTTLWLIVREPSACQCFILPRSFHKQPSRRFAHPCGAALLALISLGIPPGVKKSFIGQGLWGRLGSLTQARHGKLSANLPRTFREPSAGSEPRQIYQYSGFSLCKAVHKEKSLDSLCGRPSTKRNPLWVAVHKETCLNSLCGKASTKRNHLILFVDGCSQRGIT